MFGRPGLLSGVKQSSPAALFAAAEPGVWFDPSDLSTLYQDSAGTTPVTAPAQPVGLMLDKSQGLVLGSELVANGDFSQGSTGWTLNSGWAVSGGQATFTATGANAAIQQTGSSPAVSGRTYTLTYTVISNSLNAGLLRVGGFSGNSFFGVAATTVPSSIGQQTIRIVSTPNGLGTVFDLWVTTAATSGSITIDNISVKLLPGNHATQSTSASRPTYAIVPAAGRRNLLTYSEQFDNAAWTKNTNGGVGSVTDNAQTVNNIVYARQFATVGGSGLSQQISVIAGQTYTISVRLIGQTGSITLELNSSSGFGGTVYASLFVPQSANGELRQISVTIPVGVTTAWIRTTNNVALGSFFIAQPQFELGSTATAYQKVVTSYEVTEANVASLSYLSFDGVDDSMATSTITPGIDKVQVFAGVRKLSDAAVGTVFDMNGSGGVTNGLMLRTPSAVASADYVWYSGGSSVVSITATGFSSPITNVITGIGNIAAPIATLRSNGTQVATSSSTQGTGNYLAYPLYVGRRGGTSLPFTGNLYSLITRFGANLDNGRIAQTESWVSQKAGVGV